ncbi:hypothetical protein [Brachyspira intermedia]|uniref:hypothetical protein n=1 Tax=Brachyspira intermedia TaxID=84377 RepID=UPI003B587566
MKFSVIEQTEIDNLVNYAFNNREVKYDDFSYFNDGLISLYTASLFWNKIILEAWYQIISGRFIHCVYDEDDYLRLGLNYAVFRFKILIDKSIHNNK